MLKHAPVTSGHGDLPGQHSANNRRRAGAPTNTNQCLPRRALCLVAGRPRSLPSSAICAWVAQIPGARTHRVSERETPSQHHTQQLQQPHRSH